MSNESVLNNDNNESVDTNVDNTVSQTEVNASAQEQSSNSWLDSISEEYRTQSNINNFKDVNDLAKSYVNVQKMVGNSVRVPSQDSSEEMREEFFNKIKDVDGILVKGSDDFYTKLGRPESHDGYELLKDEDLGALEHYPEIVSEIDSFKKEAFDLGLSKEQASTLVNNRIMEFQQKQEALNSSMQSSEQELRSMWGQDFDNRLNAAKQVAGIYSEKYGESMTQLINSPVGNNPAFLNMLVELGSVYKEAGHQGANKLTFGTTPSDAMNKISELRADPGFHKAYYDDKHPGHKDAVNKLNSLYTLAKSS